ncbi:MAG: flagellar biosynthetic protein FliO [Parcubacteria group bacterium]
MAALAAARPVCAQTLGQATGPDVSWWRVLAALLLCLALGVAGAYALRARMGVRNAPQLPWRLGSAPTKRLRIIESARVGQQVDVCLIACDDREHLIAVSPQAIQVLPSPGQPEG